ncbi:MAG: thioredoxin, partial [bacterium]|nr:thioredoxin [bacterium]
MTRAAIVKLLVPTLAALVVLSACSSAGSAESPASVPAAASSEAMTDGAMSDEAMSDEAMARSGSYITLADYEADKAAFDAGTVVLFFHA